MKYYRHDEHKPGHVGAMRNAADLKAGRAVFSFVITNILAQFLIFPSTTAHKLNFSKDVHVQLAWSEHEA